MKKTFEIDVDSAEAIINSRAIIEDALTPYKGIEVTYVGFTDADGEPFEWTDKRGNTEEYAIVSFNAMNEHQLEESVEAFEEGDYQSAVNNNMSMRMPVHKAQELSAKMLGTLICHYVKLKDEDGEFTGEEALMPKSFAPIASKVAKRVSLADILASKKGKKGDKASKDKPKKVKLAEADNDDEESPKAKKKDKKDKKEKKARS